MSERIETLRRLLTKLEKRAKALEKKLTRLGVSTENYSPMRESVMREGIPLEIFTRLALMNAGFSVKGLYRYKNFELDGSWFERSIDVYATRDRIHTVPDDGGRRAGESWPERDHLLVEAKQRRLGVTWVFCELPESKKQLTSAPQEVPRVNFGFELKPGQIGKQDRRGLKDKVNTKDVTNGLAQLQYAYIPKLVDIEREFIADYQYSGPDIRYAEGVRHDLVWNLLITNAKLMLFKPSTTLADLESDNPPKDDQLFFEAPWLLFDNSPSLQLLYHQTLYADIIRQEVPEPDTSPPVIMSQYSAEIHVVNFNHLARFLSLVEDPPRINEILIQISVDGKESTPVRIT